jgi:hypothetical protein
MCAAVGADTGSTVFVAGILSSCTAATTKDSCLTHVAWANRYGGKIGCAWCSTSCVHDHNADETCTRSGLLDGFLGNWTTTVTTTEPTTPAGPTPKEIEDRVEANGGLAADKTLLGITLAWENCNDLDLELFDPAGERIYWNNLSDSHGGVLDIDMNANACASKEPVENIRFEKGASSPIAGVYTAVVRFYEQEDTMLDTDYILQIKVGDKAMQAAGNIAVRKEA